EADLLAADAARQLALGQAEEVFPAEQDPPLVHPRRPRKDPQDGADERRLPAARLADDADDPPARDPEIDVVEDAGQAVVGGDRDAEPGDGEGELVARRRLGV